MGPQQDSDKKLGLGSDITRRDFIDAAPIGAGGMLLASSAPLFAADSHYGPVPVKKDLWYGYGAVAIMPVQAAIPAR
jgi:hypothetical protein